MRVGASSSINSHALWQRDASTLHPTWFGCNPKAFGRGIGSRCFARQSLFAWAHLLLPEPSAKARQRYKRLLSLLLLLLPIAFLRVGLGLFCMAPGLKQCAFTPRVAVHPKRRLKPFVVATPTSRFAFMQPFDCSKFLPPFEITSQVSQDFRCIAEQTAPSTT